MQCSVGVMGGLANIWCALLESAAMSPPARQAGLATQSWQLTQLASCQNRALVPVPAAYPQGRSQMETVPACELVICTPPLL